ncbi:MAG: helix-turn-helix domain-containing protein [Allosphingosinicella sp.]
MDYEEHPPGEALRGLVKTFWSLAAGGEPGQWLPHQAVPDGCIEIIRRQSGRSRWDGAQPASFAVGLIDEPVTFEIGGDVRFAAVRLWPWTWTFLSAVPLAAMRGRWIEIDEPRLLGLCDRLADPVLAERTLAALLAAAPAGLAAIGKGLAGARSVADMRAATGMDARALQRWFERHVGLPPRRYLRLLRFQRAFATDSGPSLADHAAAHGFADQAHMAREFRTLAGVPAKQARRTSKGPFLK